MAKLFYRVDPADYAERMKAVKEKFGMHEEIDEEKTILMLDDESRITKITGSYHPGEDDVAMVKVILNDKSLRDYFNSVFEEPYKEKR